MTARIAMTAGYHEASYGAAELKQAYQKNWFIALGVAIAIHIVLLSTYYLVGILGPEKTHTTTPPGRLTFFVDPSPATPRVNTPPPIGRSQGQPSKQTLGAPVPVSDTKVDPGQTIPEQKNMGNDGPLVVGGNDGTAPGDLPGDIVIEEPPDIFVPGIEKDPVAIRKAEPKYPELALRAGIAGNVWVKIWVDKEGKPRQVDIFKSDNEIFNESALEAARQFLFTPALMSNGPVSVWVSLQFKFKLADQK